MLRAITLFNLLRDGMFDMDITRKSLTALDVDSHGLDDLDRKFLLTLIEKFRGGTVGIDTVAAAPREDKETLEDVYEPYLLQEGFIERTPRGRLATGPAYKHLGRLLPHRLF